MVVPPRVMPRRLGERAGPGKGEDKGVVQAEFLLNLFLRFSGPAPLCPESRAKPAGQRLTAPSGRRFCNVSAKNRGESGCAIKYTDPPPQRPPGGQALPCVARGRMGWSPSPTLACVAANIVAAKQFRPLGSRGMSWTTSLGRFPNDVFGTACGQSALNRDSEKTLVLHASRSKLHLGILRKGCQVRACVRPYRGGEEPNCPTRK